MADNQNKLEQVNSVDIDKLTITTQDGTEFDLRSVFGVINIFEDIFSNTLSGNILITDGSNFVSRFAISGRERLHIRWRTPGRESFTDMTFQVYKISGRSPVLERVKFYTFHFTSLEGIKDTITRIDQYYNAPIGKIVEDVFNNYLRNEDIPKELIDIGRTRDNVAVTVPGWNPLKLINWLCKRGVSETYRNSDYFFYETINGFHLMSLGSLAHRPVVKEYIQSTMPVRSTEDRRVRELDTEFRTYEDFTVHDSFNTFQHTQNASFASRLITHDLVTKKIEEHTYDYLKRTDINNYHKPGNQSHMEPYPMLAEGDMLTKQAKINTFFYPKHKNLHNGFKNNHAEDWLQERKSNLNLMGHVKLSLTVPGDTGGPGRSREVGDVVIVQCPSIEFDQPEFEADPYLKGKYMITAIRHMISLDDYKLKLEVSKDSLPSPIPTKNVEADVTPSSKGYRNEVSAAPDGGGPPAPRRKRRRGPDWSANVAEGQEGDDDALD